MQPTSVPRNPDEGRGRTASPPPVTLPSLSLELRLGLLRRRRRHNLLRQIAFRPVLVGLSLVTLAAYSTVAALH